MVQIDMPLPDYCMECPLFSGAKYGMCLVDADINYMGDNASYERHSYCPLQEVEE